MQISTNFGTLHEFLEIFNRITDFRNGKCMNNIGLHTGPRPVALRPLRPTAVQWPSSARRATGLVTALETPTVARLPVMSGWLRPDGSDGSGTGGIRSTRRAKWSLGSSPVHRGDGKTMKNGGLAAFCRRRFSARLRLKAGLQHRGEMRISRKGRTKVGGGRRVDLTDELDDDDASMENPMRKMARGGQR
jgi:hypothetical protein